MFLIHFNFFIKPFHFTKCLIFYLNIIVNKNIHIITEIKFKIKLFSIPVEDNILFVYFP